MASVTRADAAARATVTVHLANGRPRTGTLVHVTPRSNIATVRFETGAGTVWRQRFPADQITLTSQ